MQSGAAVANLRAGHQGRTVIESGGGRRAAGALRHVLVDRALLVRTGTEAFDRGHDHARIEFLNALPREPHAIQRPGREIFHQNVAMLDQALQDLLAMIAFGVERYRSLVVIEHREIQAVHIRQIAQLLAGDVSATGPLNLYNVGTEPPQQLSTGWPRLHVREIKNADAV